MGVNSIVSKALPGSDPDNPIGDTGSSPDHPIADFGESPDHPVEPNHPDHSAFEGAPEGFDAPHLTPGKPEEVPGELRKFGQQASRAVLTPGYGVQGMAVGAENLIEGKGVRKSIERAAEATKPEYEPPPGEKAGAFIGRLVGDAPLYMAAGAVVGPAAAAPVGAIAKAIPAMQPVAGFLGSASVGAALGGIGGVLNDMAAKGEVDPADIKASIAGGAVLGGGIHIGGDAASELMSSDAVQSLPRVVSAFVNRAHNELALLKQNYEKYMGIATPENPQVVPPGNVPQDIREAVASGETTPEKGAQEAGERFADELRAKSADVIRKPGNISALIKPTVDMLVKSGIPEDVAVRQAAAAVSRAAETGAPQPGGEGVGQVSQTAQGVSNPSGPASPKAGLSGGLFPTGDSLHPSITGHPEFVNTTQQAVDAVNRAAKERGVDPSPEFADSYFQEVHDNLWAIVDKARAISDPVARDAALAKAKQLESDFYAISGKRQMDATPEAWIYSKTPKEDLPHEAIHEGTGKKAYEMTSGEFQEIAQQAGVSGAMANDIHQGAIQAAGEAGTKIPEHVLAELPPREAPPPQAIEPAFQRLEQAIEDPKSVAMPLELHERLALEEMLKSYDFLPDKGHEPLAELTRHLSEALLRGDVAAANIAAEGLRSAGGGQQPPAQVPPAPGGTPAAPQGPEGRQPVTAGFPEQNKILIPEMAALKTKLKAAAKASQEGYVRGKTEMRQQANWELAEKDLVHDMEVAKLRQQKADIINDLHSELSKAALEAEHLKAEYKIRANWEQAIKRKITDYINAGIPLKERGRFISMVRDAKTPRNLAKAVIRIDEVRSQIYKKELIGDIKKLTERSLESPSVAVEFKQKIRELLSGVELVKHRPETLDRLGAIEQYLMHAKDQGKNVEMPESILEQIKILARQPIDKLAEGKLEQIREGLRALDQFGRTAQAVRKSIYGLQQDRLRTQLREGSHPIEKHPEFQRRPGEVVGLRAKINNRIAAALDVFQHMNMAILPIDVFMDKLDGNKGFTGPNYRLIKNVLDRDYWSYLDQKDGWINPIRDLVTSLKLNEQNFERIGIHAIRAQEGGPEYLQIRGLNKEEVDAVKLSKDELALYSAMRQTLEKPFHEVVDTLKNIYNREIKRVNNYFPYKTDFEAMHDVDVLKRLGDASEGLGRYAKTVEQGFTKSRVPGGKQAIKLNAMDIFEQHMDDVAYFINMQRDLKMIYEVVADPEHAKFVGDKGQRELVQWLDLMAKKGGADGAKRIALLDMLRRNLGTATLGFKISTALVHATKAIDGAAMIGGRNLMQGMANSLYSKEWQDFIIKNMPELRVRAADDPAFNEVNPGALEKAQRLSFAWLRRLDFVSARAVAAGAYRLNLERRGLPVDLVKPDREALDYAQLAVRRTQTSGLFKDLSLALSRGGMTGNRSLDKALFQFKNPYLNRWSFFQHDIRRLGWQQGNRVEAVESAMYMAMTTLAHMGVKRGTNAVLLALLGGAGIAAEKMLEKENDPLAEGFAKEILTNVPFMGDFISSAIYHSNIIPSWQPIDDLKEGTKAIVLGAEHKKTKQEIHGIGQALTALASMIGVPGVYQFKQIARMTNVNEAPKNHLRKRR